MVIPPSVQAAANALRRTAIEGGVGLRIKASDSPWVTIAEQPRKEKQMAVAVATQQMSLFAGGDPDEQIVPYVRLSGAISASRELEREATVRVLILDEDGTVVAEAGGEVRTVSFVTHRPEKEPAWVERAHTIGLR